MTNQEIDSFVIIFTTIILGVLVFIYGVGGLVKRAGVGQTTHYTEGQMVICNTSQELSMYQVVKDTGRFIITSDDGIYEKKDCELARDVE